mgnify:CR=1 FL=1
MLFKVPLDEFRRILKVQGNFLDSRVVVVQSVVSRRWAVVLIIQDLHVYTPEKSRGGIRDWASLDQISILLRYVFKFEVQHMPFDKLVDKYSACAMSDDQDDLPF